jgi:hypothetical protein
VRVQVASFRQLEAFAQAVPKSQQLVSKQLLHASVWSKKLPHLPPPEAASPAEPPAFAPEPPEPDAPADPESDPPFAAPSPLPLKVELTESSQPM